MIYTLSNHNEINKTAKFTGFGADPEKILSNLGARIYNASILGVIDVSALSRTRYEFFAYASIRAEYYINIEKKYKLAQYLIKNKMVFYNSDKFMIGFRCSDIYQTIHKPITNYEVYCLTLAILDALTEYGIEASLTADRML